MPFALPPLVSLAVSVLPNLAKRVADNVLPGVEQKVTNVVKEVLGTDDIQVAEDKLQDPKVAAELRVRLAEIEVEADKVEAEKEAQRRAAELEAMKLELERFRTEIADTQSARATMVDLEKSDSPLQWAPAVVSTVVVVGFFFTLVGFIVLLRFPPPNDVDNGAIIQIVNIAVGALTAGFATVISFWLGSSQGSREKDRLSVQTQATASAVATEQTRQATELIGRIAATPPVQVAAAVIQAGPKAKDARQFRRCLDLVFGFEGGFSDHPLDRGGPTNLGITLDTLTGWRRKMAGGAGQAVAVTAEDVRNLSRDDATEIYRAEYWNALNCDNLPAGVDLVVFDFGVNAGPVRAARLLQQAVHVDQDGQVGKITTGAAQSIDPAHIINTFSNGRMEHYRSLGNWETFKDGWTRRTQEIAAAALEMAKV